MWRRDAKCVLAERAQRRHSTGHGTGRCPRTRRCLRRSPRPTTGGEERQGLVPINAVADRAPVLGYRNFRKSRLGRRSWSPHRLLHRPGRPRHCATRPPPPPNQPLPPPPPPRPRVGNVPPEPPAPAAGDRTGGAVSQDWSGANRSSHDPRSAIAATGRDRTAPLACARNRRNTGGPTLEASAALHAASLGVGPA
jgi:hypothetical protein